MADNMRTCRKTACRWPAAASLSYRYDSRQVWLLDLSEDADPSLYDLCPPHADALVVPRGWERVDQRTHAEPVAEPAGRDLLAVPGREPVGAAGYGRNRYEALSADLPRLAEELAAENAAENTAEDAAEEGGTGSAEGAGPDPRSGAAADQGPSHHTRTSPAPPPRPSRDLAPLAVDGPRSTQAAPSPQAAAPGSPAPQTEDQVPGQLAIPVAQEDARVGEAVVVSIDAGRRRSSMSR